MPRLIIPSLQVNMRAGELPPPDKSGKDFLKVPINALQSTTPRERIRCDLAQTDLEHMQQ